jgi:hypothetical protein
MLSLSSRSVGRVARPARLVSRNRRARIGTSVPQRGFRRGIVRAAAADADEDADAADDETHREYDETYDETHLEDASTHTEDDDADVAAFKAFSADLDARYGLQSQPPPRAAYVSTPAGPSSSLNPQGAPVTPMSGVQNNIFNVGLLSTAVLGIWAVKKATDAFNSIPNLAAEDRLLRMSDFADAAMERAKEMPDGKAKDKELARVTKLKASIDGKKAKLLEAERRRDEWERRIKRVDSDGVPVVKNAAAARERARREARAPASARRGTDTGGDDDMKGEERDGSTSSSSSEESIDGEASQDSQDDSIDSTKRSSSADARYEAAMARAQARERAPPGAGARWMKASDYLQRQMDKTAVGYSPEEAVDDQIRQSDSEIKITEEDAAKEAKAKAAKEAEEYRAKAKQEADAKAAREEAEAARAKAMAEAEAEAKAEVKTVPPTPAFDSARGKGPVFDPEIVDNMDDLKGGNLSPQDELELEREIKRLEERYGDDRNVSAEELDAKCQVSLF